MKSQRDYYAILEISHEASEEVIRSAYKALAKKYHPDIAKATPDADKRMVEINAAYAVLSNPTLKATYDSSWQRDRISYGKQASTASSASPPEQENERKAEAGNNNAASRIVKKRKHPSLLFFAFLIVIVVVIVHGHRSENSGGVSSSADDVLKTTATESKYNSAPSPTASPPAPVPTESAAPYPLDAKWDTRIEALLDEADNSRLYDTQIEKYTEAIQYQCLESVFRYFVAQENTGNNPDRKEAYLQAAEDISVTAKRMTESIDSLVVLDTFDWRFNACYDLFEARFPDIVSEIEQRLDMSYADDSDYWESFLLLFNSPENNS